MKKLNLTALLLGVALFTGFGAVSLSASDMKCGAGKCGGNMEKPMKKGDMKCGAEMKEKMKEKKKKMMEKKEAMKCGKGKCGGN